MKHLLSIMLIMSLLLLPGCSSLPMDTKPSKKEPITGQLDPQPSIGNSTSDMKEPRTLSGNKPGSKNVIPKTSTDGFSLEYITYPKLVDISSNYITQEFMELEGLFGNPYWSPVLFLDNNNFLFLARSPQENDYAIYRYNLETKIAEELFKRQGYEDNFFIQDISNFAIVRNTALISIKNDQVDKQLLFDTWWKEHKEYETYDIVANPYTEKVFLYNVREGSILTDLCAESVVQLPFKGVYRACWIDDENLILGTFDKIDRYGEGSAIVTYNIRSKASTKTYIGEREVFVDPYRNIDNYCGFKYIDDYTGPPHGTIGIVDYFNKKILFLELENAAEDVYLQYNWILAAVAENPIDWKVWGRTTEATVRLCVYDIATDSYIIRDNALPPPNRSIDPRNIIISPDGKKIVYKSEDKVFINQAK